MKLVEGIVQDFQYFTITEDENVIAQAIENWKASLKLLRVMNLKLDAILRKSTDYSLLTIQDNNGKIETYLIEDPVGFLNKGEHVILIEDSFLKLFAHFKTIGLTKFRTASLVLKLNGKTLYFGCSKRSALRYQAISGDLNKRIKSSNFVTRSNFKEVKGFFRVKKRTLGKNFEAFFTLDNNDVVWVQNLPFTFTEHANFAGWNLKGKVVSKYIVTNKYSKFINKYGFKLNTQIYEVENAKLYINKSKINLYAIKSPASKIQGKVERVYPILIKGDINLLEKINSYSNFELIHMFYKTIVNTMSKFDFSDKQYIPSNRTWRYIYFNGFIIKELLQVVSSPKNKYASMDQRIERIKKAFNKVKAEIADTQRGLLTYQVNFPIILDEPLLTAFLLKLSGDPYFRIALAYPNAKDAFEIPITGINLEIEKINYNGDLEIFKTIGPRVGNKKFKNVNVFLTSRKIPINPKGEDVSKEYRSFFAFLKNPQLINNLFLQKISTHLPNSKLSKNFGYLYHAKLSSITSYQQLNMENLGPFVYCEGRGPSNSPAIFILKEYPYKYNSGKHYLTLIQKGSYLYEVI